MAKKEKSGSQEILYEVWNDTVSRRDLGIASVIGIIITLAAYIISAKIFSTSGLDAGVYRGYALMVGVVFCLVSGVINSAIFKPKRDIQEEIDADDVVEALNHLGVDIDKEIEELQQCEPDVIEDIHRNGLDALIKLRDEGVNRHV